MPTTKTNDSYDQKGALQLAREGRKQKQISATTTGAPSNNQSQQSPNNGDDLSTAVATPIQSIPGSRTLSVNQLLQQVKMMTDHSASCGGKCILIDETKVCGLASVLCFKCIKCSRYFKVKSSQKVKLNDGTVGWAVNLSAVLGQISTGGGHS
uniref:Mutator-like transposase domain-containing protein n=1 Tax=Amphimedon queenslandica TaxID=400682 RepID=A0A1X7U704_AMPQE